MKLYVEQTGGDWRAIELPSGSQYRLSGTQRVEITNQLRELLTEVEPDHNLRQSGGLTEVKDAPWIRDIIPESSGTAFRVHADDESEFTLTPVEIKTLLV